MGMAATPRQAMLRTEGADRYPTIPVRMWTSAAGLAELVALTGGSRVERLDFPAQDRILSVAHFQFRGGRPGWTRGSLARTRLGESARDPALLLGAQ
jgi:hypothetical protein